MSFPQPASVVPDPVALGAPATPAFSAGSVISRSFSVWLGNFVPFSLVTLAAYLPSLALAAFAPPEPGQGWNLADTVLSGLSGLVTTGALTSGVLESLRGRRARVGSLFATGFRRMGSVFLVSLGIGLRLLFGAFLFVVPAIVWYCALYVAIPAVVVETELGVEALDRSRQLTKGHRWAVFAVVAVTLVVGTVVAALAGLLATLLEAVPHPIPSLVATICYVLVSALDACAAAVVYHDLRAAKEGVGTADLVKVFE